MRRNRTLARLFWLACMMSVAAAAAAAASDLIKVEEGVPPATAGGNGLDALFSSLLSLLPHLPPLSSRRNG